jgi:hypothetical protein
MRDHKPLSAVLKFQNFAVKPAWIRGIAVSTGGILLFCCCITILTVSSCTLSN